MVAPPYDLLVIGGGINGTGIARDAAGRGLRVLLAEQNDLASATSSESTKLIHGGLRYLEYYEFRLVAEALAEREVLLANAPHIIAPLAFVLPHEPHLRPAWMIRIGLFLYDHMGGRMTLPKSFGVKLAGSRFAAGLKPRFGKGFVYADAWVDDARLVVVNALDAQARGADIRLHTRVAGARRDGGLWAASLIAADGAQSEVTARALVNAAGPWVKRVLDSVRPPRASEGDVRHIKGSHIVVPRIHPEEHAYILQNADHRIVFVIPYHDRYSLIGTTDIPVDAYEHPRDFRRRDGISAGARQRVSRTAAFPIRHRLDLQRRAAAVRRRVRRSFGGDARLRAEGRRARRRAGAGACTGTVDLRRQDHDVSQACRACAVASSRRTFRR